MSEMLYDTLETCLKELEGGADLESVLARYPQLSDELHPILDASIKARSMTGPEPSPDAVHRGRARVMQRAAELRETGWKPGVAAGKSRKVAFPFIQRLAIAISLAVLLIAASGISGIGLLIASASALPGDRLYPVKRGWEGVRLMFALNPETRSALETRFNYERLTEVTRLLAEGRIAPVEFAGFYFEVDGQVYVSGVQVIVLDTTLLPTQPLANGMAVLVRGSTTTDGMVYADLIQLLANPAVIPHGNPVPTPIITVLPGTPIPTPSAVNTPTPTLTPQSTAVSPAPVVTQPPNTNGNTNSNGNSNSNHNDNDDDDDDNDNNDD